MAFRIPDTWRDTAERLFWTIASLVLAEIPVVLADLDQWWVLPITGVVNWLLIQVRKRTSVLPSPGEGLPGLPTDAVMVPPPQG
jgi:hypothetical protein